MQPLKTSYYHYIHLAAYKVYVYCCLKWQVIVPSNGKCENLPQFIFNQTTEIPHVL